MILKATGIVSI